MGESPGGDLTETTYLGERKPVSKVMPNCTTTAQRGQVAWTQTTGVTDTFGVSFTVEVGFGDIKTAVTTKYEHSWLQEASYSENYNYDVPPGYFGWVERAQLMAAYTGKWRT
ncbi:hypothetical protein AB0D93_13825, partial [Streptomyces sp. NPDC048191]